MLEKGLKKGIYLFFAFLVLSSTLSFAVSKHYCAGKLKDVSLFISSKNCMGQNVFSATSSSSYGINAIPCCETEINFHEGQDQLVKNSPTIQIDAIDSFVNRSHSNEPTFVSCFVRKIAKQSISPPNRKSHIHIFHQVFLI